VLSVAVVSMASALVLELVDRHDSGSCVRKGVEVQVLSRAFLSDASKTMQVARGDREYDRSLIRKCPLADGIGEALTSVVEVRNQAGIVSLRGRGSV
jgi:hypothetical protein